MCYLAVKDLFYSKLVSIDEKTQTRDTLIVLADVNATVGTKTVVCRFPWL